MSELLADVRFGDSVNPPEIRMCGKKKEIKSQDLKSSRLQAW